MYRKVTTVWIVHEMSLFGLCALIGVAAAPVSRAVEATGAESKTFPGAAVRLVLPKVIYAVPGIEANVYFDNVVLVVNPDNYIFDVTCDKGFQYDQRWTYTPKSEDVGDYPFTIEVRDQSNAVIARATSIIRVGSGQARGGGRVALLAMGDSHLQRDVYLQHVLDLSVADPDLELTLVGSRGSGNKPPTSNLRHEGYNGWTAQAFITRTGPKPRTGYYVPAETGSPFLYEQEDGGPRLDFARYCRDFNDGAAPGFVVIQVGGNDIWRATDDDIDKTIDDIFKYFDQLIAMVHDHDAKTRVGLVIVDSPSRSQHGFRNYQGPRKQTRWQYRHNQHRMYERMVERYSDRNGENLYLIPVNVYVDCVHGFPLRELPINARMPTKEKRVNDGSHLSPEGYRQFGDAIYAWMKCCLTER